MPRYRLVALSILSLSVAGCVSTANLDELSRTKPTGPAFTQALSQEYLAFAESERQQYDWHNADYFATKGLAAAQGNQVAPVDPGEWEMPAEARPEVDKARARLVAALDGGARTRLPAVSATAQVKFDCWIEQLEESWQNDHIEACRRDLYTALEAIEAKPVSVPEAKAQVPPPATSQREMIVFFDFDRANINESARPIVDAAAGRAKEMNYPRITIVGHADRSGPANYNQRLSLKRAESLKRALSGRGVPPAQMDATGHGEAEPLVPTPDGIREPQNRRAVITFPQ